MFNFEENFFKIFSNFKFHENIYIAYSGGIDSSVLLYLSYKFFNKKKKFIRAIHIDHGYTNRSYSWSIFCKKICDEYKIPIIIFNSNFKKKRNIEQEFRFIRFNFFLNFIFKNSTLLLAHNKDDFLETMFLRLFRGSNLFSIFGIQKINKLGKLNIVRPLIHFSKHDISKLAFLKKIKYINDFSNLDIKFSRNFLRSKILPLVKVKWPNFDKVILKSFIISVNFYNYFYFRYLFFFRSKGFNFDFLDIKYLLLLPYVIRCEIIKLWIKVNNFKTPSYNQLKELNKILNSKTNKFSFIFIKDYFIRKKNDNIVIDKNICNKNFFNLSIYSNTFFNYYFFNKVIVLNVKLFFIKNFFIVKSIDSNFLILGLFYNKTFLKSFFLFKSLY
ncbi:MAG TPA: tRNA lysidine(34) synthetase TilS [Candidatus Azoamicus sp.]